MMKRISSFVEALGEPRFFVFLPLLVLVLLSAGFDAGWMVDDHVHRAVITQHPDLPELHRPASMLFSFADGEPESMAALLDGGLWPWWAAPDLRLSFLRPLASWTHAFDYWAWPQSPWWMHVHSAVWYALSAILLLGFYRRVLPVSSVAGLAALLYAIDDSQAFPALWLANRNTLVSLVFGVASLWAHDRWRRDGWRAGRIVSPLCLVLALLGNEGAVSIGGYLLAHALFLDPAPARRRWRALVPGAGVGLLWTAAYKLGGFGASGSGVYIDPASEPGRFLLAAVERAPVLLAGWWSFPPSDAFSLLSGSTRWVFWGYSLAVLAMVGWLLSPLIRRLRVARFFALGMVLALVPACSTFPSNRLLAFVGIGAAGLLGLLFQDLWGRLEGETDGKRWPLKTLLAGLVLIHGILPPLLIYSNLEQMERFEALLRNIAASISVESGIEGRDPEDRELIVVATPSAFTALGAGVIQALGDTPRPRRTRVLASGIYGAEVERTEAQTLVVRPVGGFLRPHSAAEPHEVCCSPRVDPRRIFLLVDSLFRDLENDPFQVGDQLAFEGIDIEILEADEGRPLAASFRFAEPLESERWVWRVWRDGRFLPFDLPAVGSRVEIPGLPTEE